MKRRNTIRMAIYEDMKQRKVAGTLWQNGTNPLFPAWEYVPDGEPHIFGDRVYVFGSGLCRRES
jgi:hypothetical protein